MNTAHNQPINSIPMNTQVISVHGTSTYPSSDYENSWRSKFWRLPVLILGIVELIFTVLIIILEIASLGLFIYQDTGAGIWCSISFMTAAILTLCLVFKWDRSRVWATRVLIAQIVLIVFSLILIGILGNFVSTDSAAYSMYAGFGVIFIRKYQVMQAELAFAILLLFAGIAYNIFYGIITYVAIWKPFHTLDTPHLFRE